MPAIASFGFALLVLAFAGGGAWGLWHAAGWAANSRRWLLIAVCGGIVTAITLGVMAEIAGVLGAMHPLGRVGGGVMDVIGNPDRARNTVDAWQTWFTLPHSAAARPPITPRTVSLWYLGIDTLALVPAYVLFLGVLLRRSRNALDSEATKRLARTEDVDESTLARFTTVAQTAAGFFAAVPFFDILENGMLWRFIERRIQACGSGACVDVNVPGDGFVLLLRLVSYAKLGFLFAALVIALAPAAVWLRLGADWLRSIRPAIRRLRGEFVLLALFFILMKANPQTVDVFRGWDLAHAFPAIAASFLAGLVTWSVGRRVTYVRRGRDADGNVQAIKDPARTRQSMIRLGLLLVVVGGLGVWFDLAPRGLVIPGAFLLLLAWFDRAGEAVEVPEPEPSDRGRDTIPAGLAAAWPILLTYFMARALFPLTMYDKADPLFYTAGVFVLWTLVVPALAIGANYYGLLHTIAESAPQAASKIKRAVSAAMTTTAPTATSGVPWFASGLIVVGAILWLRVVMNPWAVGQALGAVTLVVAFFAVLSAVVGLASVFIERTDPPGLFKVLRMRRIPLFSMVVLWLVLTNVVPRIDREDFHDIRTMQSGISTEVTSMSSLDVFQRWVANQPALAGTGSPGEPRQAVPMILVASEGGGIKAAMWTAVVLDCMLSAQPVACPSHGSSRLGSVIAESGVSGGSVGLVTYTRYAADPSQIARPGDWIERTLGADFVSPSIAWQLYVETPRAWLQFDAGMDRAEVLERGLEQAWLDDGRFGFLDALFGGAPASQGPLAEGFRAFWANNPQVPLMLLNGFSIQDGCKFVMTPIDGNGPESDSLNCVAPHAGLVVPPEPSAGRPGFLSSSRVLSDLLCDPEDDVRLSTAALLAARFTYVSPSGRVLSCAEPRRAFNVVDGGYGENTGAGSVLELWDSIRPLVDQYNGEPGHGACIVPALLQIQSGYGPSPDAPSQGQGELTVPPKGIIKAPNGITVWQRNAAQLAVLDPLPFTGSATQAARQGVYALVYPYAHPGAEAPLGWTLSDEARSDLRAQLSAEGNVAALGALEQFLSDPGTCAPVEQAQAFSSGP